MDTQLQEILKEFRYFENETGKEFLIKMYLPKIVIRCELSGITETIGIDIKFIPSSLLLDTVHFRKAFQNVHFEGIFETIVSDVFNHLEKNLKPKSLFVKVYRDDGKMLDWSAEYSNFKA